MKVADLKSLIRECVVQSIQQLKEQFEHIELKKKGRIAGQKPTVGDGVKSTPVDAGDQKMKQAGQPFGKKPANCVCGVKDQKGAMNEMVQHPGSEPLKHTVANDVCKVCGKTEDGAMKQAVAQSSKDAPVLPEKKQKQEGKKDMKEAIRPMPAATPARVPPVRAAPVRQDVSLQVPLPPEAKGAEVSAEVTGQGDEQVAELIIVDDQIKPQDISNDMIQIEIPDMEGREGGDIDVEVEDELPGGQMGRGLDREAGAELPPPQGREGVEGEEDDDFGRMRDLAGLKK